MLIAVVSDTHGHLEFTRDAVRVLESIQVEQILHCGDIGFVQVISLFSPWPTHFVFGNVDGQQELLREEIRQGEMTCHDLFGDLELEGKRIAILHGDDERRLQQTIDSGQWDLVCHGHTHVAEQRYRGKTLVLNPGAVYRARARSIAVVELPSMEVTPVLI